MWVEFTEEYSESKVLVNKYQVKAIYKESPEAKCWCIGMDRITLYVKEDYEQIKQLLESGNDAKCE